MRLSLPRSPLHRIMVAVAAVAAVVGGDMFRRHLVGWRARMAYHSSERGRLTADMDALLVEASSNPATSAVILFDAERHRRAAAWHAEREWENRRAMWRLWVSVGTDRMDPPWPEIPPELQESRPPDILNKSDRPGMLLINALLFQPTRFPLGEWSATGPVVEDVWFQAPDGPRLNGWFVEALQPRAVVLYAEGNAGNITDRRGVLELFRDRLGASILIFDYRGYGRSEGSPSVAGILADARAARRWLAERTGVPEQGIVLVGNSLGGAVVVDMAARDGARGLILENTFSSLADVAEKHFGRLARLVTMNQLDSASLIRGYQGPILQTHGDADTVIPCESGRRLFDSARQPKQFIEVLGGGHNDPHSREYLTALDGFLGSLPLIGEKQAQTGEVRPRK